MITTTRTSRRKRQTWFGTLSERVEIRIKGSRVEGTTAGSSHRTRGILATRVRTCSIRMTVATAIVGVYLICSSFFPLFVVIIIDIVDHQFTAALMQP